MGSDDEELSPLAAMPDKNPLPDEVAERHDLQQSLQRAIQSLPPKFRAVVLLSYAAQLSFSEIGQALSMSEATCQDVFPARQATAAGSPVNRVAGCSCPLKN